MFEGISPTSERHAKCCTVWPGAQRLGRAADVPKRGPQNNQHRFRPSIRAGIRTRDQKCTSLSFSSGTWATDPIGSGIAATC
jgi:hypothetical protein